MQKLLRAQFPGVRQSAIDDLPEELRDPLASQLRTVVLVAESDRAVRGFAVLRHAPDLAFCYLDFISAAPDDMGRGVGGALYERVRAECRVLGAQGLFFECLPDQPEHVSDPALLPMNAARLRFYERYGARPIDGTLYNAPIQPGDRDMPYLVFDDLDSGRPLLRREARAIVRAILERKYAWLCPPEYIAKVVRSFRDNPVRLRPFRYVRRRAARAPAARLPNDERILLVMSREHAIHHVRERGDVEAPARVSAIARELAKLDAFERVRPKSFSDAHVTAVHDARFVTYLKRVCSTLRGDAVYPHVFPLRHLAQPPNDLAVRAGYYCVDTFTPLARDAWLAARRAVDCALTGASALLAGRAFAYALVRPPGHHASRRAYGGFCYLNSAAIAVHYLSRRGKVALLDLDYHHGSGHQQLFWERADVLTVSIHAHPRFAYPYFTGFANERGAGAGAGANFNFPLPERVDGVLYGKYLLKALALIQRFEPQFLVVSLGFDSGQGDPTGSWDLDAGDFEQNGLAIARTRLPALFVQEGGYHTRNLGRYARHFFAGLMRLAL